MAEAVQYYLESMISDLKEFEEKNIFRSDEIKSIIKERRKHEYRLKRRIPKKVDFLRYIEYECQLEQTRKDRTVETASSGKTKKDSSEFSIVKNIHSIFQRAIRVFKGDKELVKYLISFSKSNDTPLALGKIFAEAVKMHPTCSEFWIMSSNHEFEVNGNMEAARALMQRALRVCPLDRNLWIEYLKLELRNLVLISERKKKLGIEIESKSLAVPAIVVKNSLEKFTDDQFRCELVKVLREFRQLPGVDALIKENVLGTSTKASCEFIERHMYSDEEFSDKFALCLSEYDAYLKDTKSSEVLEHMINFMMNAQKLVDDKNVSNLIQERISMLLELSDEMDILSEDLYQTWIQQSFSNTSEDGLTIQLLNKALQRYPRSPTLWKMRLEFLIRSIKVNSGKIDKISFDKIYSFYLSTVQTVDKFDASMSEMFLTWAKQFSFVQSVRDEYIRLLKLGYFNFLPQFLKWNSQVDSLESSRAFYNEMRENSIVSKEFYEGCLAFELENKQSESQVRFLFEKVLDYEPQNCALWIQYLKFEMENKQFETASRLFWKASKIVTDKLFLSREFQKLKQ